MLDRLPGDELLGKHHSHVIQIRGDSYRLKEKLKAGIFDGPQIRELMKDTMFDGALNAVEIAAWQSLKSVITNFLGNRRSPQYEREVDVLLKSFQSLKARMSVKLHFIRSHLDYFPENWKSGKYDFLQTFKMIKQV